MIYVDNSATTRVRPEVLEAMLPYFGEEYGNPSSVYKLGRDSQRAIEDARASIASLLGAKPQEIYFTGCGSESDNWAIRGAVERGRIRLKGGVPHVITTAIEHHAVLDTVGQLVKEGYCTADIVPVSADGFVSAADIEAAIKPETCLISVMYANNEIGTIQPVAKIGAIARKHKILFHCDAVQAVGSIPVDVEKDNIDLMAVSGHKFHAPKGIGIMYMKRGCNLPNYLTGGGQERGKRAGTENTAYIVGIAKALELAVKEMPEKAAKLSAMRDKVIDSALKIPYSRLNGARENRLPGNVSLCFKFIEGESLLLMLDYYGIQASSGSACTSGSLDPSHVLLALGLPHEIAHGSLRISFGKYNDPEDADRILEVLPEIVQKIRDMSPLYDPKTNEHI